MVFIMQIGAMYRLIIYLLNANWNMFVRKMVVQKVIAPFYAIRVQKNMENTEARILLARVHLRLGDHELDNGQLIDAIRDYSECLSLRLSSLPATDRRIADAHTSLAMAHLYNSVPRENVAPSAQAGERDRAAITTV